MTTATYQAKLRRRMKDTNASAYFFQQNDLDDVTDQVVQSLWPFTWQDTVVEVLINDTNKKKITFASEVTRLDDVRVLDSDGQDVGTYNAFYKVGSIIYATQEFPTNYTFRFIVSKKYTTIEECPDEYADYLLDKGELFLVETLEMDRAKYYKYTTTIRPEGGNMPSLSRVKDSLKENVIRRKNELRRVRESTQINLVG